MASYLGWETIVARYFGSMVITIEVKKCDYCSVGEWSVVEVSLKARTGYKTGFDLYGLLRCTECLGEDGRRWPFNPYGKVQS